MISHSFYQSLAEIAIVLPAFIVALSFHEYAHALAATLLGDSTPKRQHRLTLNPLAHVDFLGLFCLLIFRIGWAKPVAFSRDNFKHPKLYSILTALAGPGANFLLAITSMLSIKHFPVQFVNPAISISMLQILRALAEINVMLGVFNLLPIPPLDGSHVLTAFLIERSPQAVDALYRYSMLVLIFICFFPATRMLLNGLINVVYNSFHGMIF